MKISKHPEHFRFPFHLNIRSCAVLALVSLACAVALLWFQRGTNAASYSNGSPVTSSAANNLTRYAFPVVRGNARAIPAARLNRATTAAPALPLFVAGIAPNGDPGAGFEIEGDLRANTPTANTSDWTPGVPGTGVGVLTAAGVPVDPVKTFHVLDLFNDQADNKFKGGLKYVDNPNTWQWVFSKAGGKLDMNHGLLHVSNDVNDHLWVTVASDRLSTNGNSYLDFEFLQNTLTANQGGTFTSAGPNAGRTVGDLLLTLELTNGGTQPNFFVQRWEADAGSPIGFTYHTITPGAGTTFSAANIAGTTPVSFNAFGAANYQQFAFAEAALDITALIQNLNPCIGIVSVLMKTKSSQSPTADLDDFILPIQLALGTNPTANAGPDLAACQTVPGPTVFNPVGTATNGTVLWDVLSTTGGASAGIINDTTLTPTVNVNGTGTVTLRLRVTSQTCGTVTDTVVLTVSASASAAAGADQTLCQATSGPTVFTLNGSVTAGSTPPLWSVFATTGTAAATIVSPNSALTNVNVTGIGTVTLRLTSTVSCGTANDDVVLTVNPNPTAGAGNDLAQCQANPQPNVFNLTGTGTNGTPQWSVTGMTGTATATISNGNTLTPTVNVSGVGTITVTLTVTSNTNPSCGQATDEAVLTVNPLPDTTITAPNAVCANSTGNSASVPNAGAGATYLWSITNGSITAGQSTPSITWTAGTTSPATLSVTVTTAANCAANGSKQVTINPLPNTTITAPNAVCATSLGNTASVPDAGAGATYAWSVTGGTLVSGNGTPMITWNAGAGATVTLNVTVMTGANCTALGTKNVTVNALPTCNITGANALCTGVAGTQYSGPAGMASYSWSIAGNGTINGATNAQTVSVTAGAAGSFTLTLTVTDASGCSSTCMKQVTVNAPPVCNITGADSLCTGVANQTYSGPAGAFNYFWSIAGNGTINGATNGQTVSVTAGATGSLTLTLTVTDQVTGCSSTCQKVVTVNTLPACNITGANALCTGAAGAQFSGPAGMTAYSWSIAGNGTINGATNAQTVSVTAGAAGSFTLTLTVTAPGGCMSTCMKQVTVNALPTCNITGANALCANVSGAQFSGPAGAASYSWSVAGNGTINGATNQQTVSVTAGAAGSFTLSLTVTDANGCSSTCIKQVTVNALPACNITGPSNVCPDASANYSGPAGAASYLWSVTGAGIINGSNNGQTVNVTSTQVGTFTLTLTVTDANGCSSTCQKVVTVEPFPNATITATMPVISASTGNTASVPNAGPGATYNWSIVNGTITNGQGTPNITFTAGGGAGTLTLNVIVTSALGCASPGTKQIQIVCPPLTITPPALPNAPFGVPYSQQLGAIGGTGPYTFTHTGGTLPPPLTLTPGGLLSGTPNQAGNFTFTITVTDQFGCTGQLTYSVSTSCPVLTLSPNALPNPTSGVFYSQTITGNGGQAPYSFMVQSGALPPGLSLSAGGVLSGVPNQSGPFSFVIKATDANGCMGTLGYSVNVACPAITVNPPTLPNPVASVFYNQTVSATGGNGSISFMVSGGALPNGLSLNIVTGAITGTPAAVGPFSFTIKATDAFGCMGTRTYTGTVGCPAITVAQPPPVTAGQAYSFQLSATPAGGNYTFAVTAGALPSGLTLTPGGLLSGTVMMAGPYTFTITATGFGGQCSGSVQVDGALNFVVCPTITLSPATLPNGTGGTAYNQSVTASPNGGNYTYTVTSGALPPGLSLDPATGAITGTPTTAGTYNFTITATGFGICAASKPYALTINCPALTLNPATLPNGQIGTPYSQTLTVSPAGGNYTWMVSVGALPAGLTLNANTGVISGTPTANGSAVFTVKATGFGACTGTRQFTLTIGCAPITFSPTTLPDGIAGQEYTPVTITTNPPGAYTFSLLLGQLPPGYTIGAQSGIISGFSNFPGNYCFTLKVTGVNGCIGTVQYCIRIVCPTITVNPSTLPNSNVNTPYSQTITGTPPTQPGVFYTFAVSSGTLPPGLTLNNSTGVLSGTPTTIGAYTFTIRITGFTTCTGSRSYTVTIAGVCPAITPAALPTTGKVGTPYLGDLSGTQPFGSYSFALTAGALPPGMFLDSFTNAVAGTPTATGAYTFTLQATNGQGCTGSRSYTLTISTGMAALAQIADYDGDNRADPVLWSASAGAWRMLLSGDQQPHTAYWGTAGDVPLLGDYDGDGQSDLVIFRPSGATWYVKCSDGNLLTKALGASGDLPVPGDYDGDGKTDFAVWRGATGEWLIERSSDQTTVTRSWGSAASPYLDVPVAGDYDGDGKTDVGVFRRGTGTWLIKQSGNGQFLVKAWGMASDVPVPRDYDGDGKTDIAVWRGGDTNWYVWRSSTSSAQVVSWGTELEPFGDVPSAHDYDGDGKSDVAVWRALDQTWYIRNSATGAVRVLPHGQNGDRPVWVR